MYAGNMVWSNVATVGVIAIVIGFTLLPIWPDAAKKVLWYISVTFLIATLVFCLFRFVAFLVMWLLGYEFWIFPRLFDESLSFQDSFKPVYTFEKGSPGQGYYRIGVVVCIIAFIYWASTQPTEFDGFLKAQKDFIDDLYTGNLLADVSQDHKDNLDRTKRGGGIPNIEDLLREMQEEERIDSSPHDFTTDNDGNNNLNENIGGESSLDKNSEVEFDSEVNLDDFDESLLDDMINNLNDIDE
jgi:translocation protein SEC62